MSLSTLRGSSAGKDPTSVFKEFPVRAFSESWALEPRGLPGCQFQAPRLVSIRLAG